MTLTYRASIRLRGAASPAATRRVLSAVVASIRTVDAAAHQNGDRRCLLAELRELVVRYARLVRRRPTFDQRMATLLEVLDELVCGVEELTGRMEALELRVETLDGRLRLTARTLFTASDEWAA